MLSHHMTVCGIGIKEDKPEILHFFLAILKENSNWLQIQISTWPDVQINIIMEQMHSNHLNFEVGMAPFSE